MIINKTVELAYNRELKLFQGVIHGRLLKYLGGTPPNIYALLEDDGVTRPIYVEKVGPGDTLTHLNMSDYAGSTTGTALFIRTE